MPNTVRIFTFAQLEALWVNNGGSRALAPTMAAIALAESSGNPASVNRTDNNGRQTSWGLWQVSDGTHNMPAANILDPNVNAKQAVAKYKSQGLGAWGTYTSGKYRDFIKNGVNPDNNGLPSGSTSTADQASVTGDIGGAIGKGLGDAFAAVLQPVISTMIWSGEVLFGILLMLGGVIVFIVNTEAGKKTTSAAVNAATLAAAPEVAPELRSAQTAARKPAGQARVARSREEFQKIRKSGYNGPVRHEY